MRVSVAVGLISILLTGCQPGLQALSVNQGETLSLTYEDNGNKRDVKGVSTTGESFNGSLIWGGDINGKSHGQYQGTIIGDKGRSLQVVLECNRLQLRCTGTAKDNNGAHFYIF